MEANPVSLLARLLRGAAARLLERRLRRIPVHVAIIPDGNRRWARRRGLPIWAGHLKGYMVMRRVLDWLWELGVRHVTIYALSRENCLRRPRDELEKLFEILRLAYADLWRDQRVERGEVWVRTVGDLEMVPGALREEALGLEEATRGAERTLNICLCYSGRWEILEAVKRLRNVERTDIDEELFTKLMPLGDVHPPDLIIRSGGEMRLSNFLLWHAAYSELYFTRRLWPDFDRFELMKALVSYSRRERRFGA